MLLNVLAVTGYEISERELIHGVIAVLIGIAILIRPSIVYFLVGGYLLIFGALGLYFQHDPVLSGAAIVFGILIFLFPKLIPYLFAAYLAVFAVYSFVTIGVTGPGLLSVVIAFLLLLFPNILAYLVGGFLLVNGVLILLQPMF